MSMTVARQILPTLTPCDPNDGSGYVGRVPEGSDVRDITTRLQAAGYEVSDSRDEDGVSWVWVAMSMTTKINMGEPVLYRYEDAAPIRNATADELAASRRAEEHDGGAGVISIDGIRCYVTE